MPQRNLAVELLETLLKGEIRARAQRNVVQARSFGEMPEQSLRRYQSRAIEAAQVIEAMIQPAKDMRAAAARGEGSVSPMTRSPSTTRSKPTTARSRCRVTPRFAP